jgi:hypothetical protein
VGTPQKGVEIIKKRSTEPGRDIAHEFHRAPTHSRPFPPKLLTLLSFSMKYPYIHVTKSLKDQARSRLTNSAMQSQHASDPLSSPLTPEGALSSLSEMGTKLFSPDH